MICASYKKFAVIKDATICSSTSLQNTDRVLYLVKIGKKKNDSIAYKSKVKEVQNICKFHFKRKNMKPTK